MTTGKVIAMAGKGGVGKTSLLAVLIDELARSNCAGRLLVVDADPSLSLHQVLLGQPWPGQTLADIREQVKFDAGTLNALPPGQTPVQYILAQLQAGRVINRVQLRQMSFDFLAMGSDEARPGCYCRINGVLNVALKHICQQYDLVLIDNEAGPEHLSRRRVDRIDLLLLATGTDPVSANVAARIARISQTAGLDIRAQLLLCLGCFGEGVPSLPDNASAAITIPLSAEVRLVARQGRPFSDIGEQNPGRRALQPVIERIQALLVA